MVVAPTYNPRRAVAFMLLAAAVLPGINACAKALDPFPVVQVTWARYAGHFLFMMIVFAPANGVGMLRSARPGLQLSRSALHCASALLTFSALGSVPLPTATAISFTAPLMVVALAPLLLSEKLTGDRAIAVLLGFLGALVIVRPGLGGWNLAIGYLLLNAVASACVQILSRKVSGHDRAVTSNTYMVLIGFVLLSVPLPFVWRTPTEVFDIALFAAIGLFGGIGHFFLVSAFEQAPASFVSPFNYMQIVAATALGWVLFDQLPDVWTWIGTAIIAFSGIFLLVRESRRRVKA